MTDGERSARLARAVRENRRRRAVPALLAGLETHVGLLIQPACVRSLSESDALNLNFEIELERRRGAKRLQEYGSLKKEEFQRRASEMSLALGDSSVWFMLAHWVNAGAIVIEARRLAECATGLLRFDGDTVWGGSEDVKAGFYFDYSADTELYELAFWTGDSAA